MRDRSTTKGPKVASNFSSREFREKHTKRDLGVDEGLLDANLDANLLKCNEATFVCRKPTTGLGALERLPAEMLQTILLDLDLNTFGAFTCVNRRSLEVVESLSEYSAVMTHAPKAYLGALTIKSGAWITFRRLYEKLCTRDCETCGDFGGYLYLITCKRVCFICLVEDKRYLPLDPGHATDEYGFDRHTLRMLPRMAQVQGNYSPQFSESHGRLFIDYQSIVDAAVKIRGSVDAVNQQLEKLRQKRNARFQRELTEIWDGIEDELDLLEDRGPPGPSHERQYSNPLRFMAITRAPWFNKSTRGADWGVNCRGCGHTIYKDLDFKRKFTEDTFQKHLEELGDGKAAHFAAHFAPYVSPCVDKRRAFLRRPPVPKIPRSHAMAGCLQ
ncbi:hypothetical protein B0J13DRAFT_288384 [Dactylonectria estremocensis]|uniref:F-box domain-containing protein n=1 Tax=Dactylonectria estremocensis TaxID=1079267 RepID=A0A9P9J9I5_9HYPO|nr:hypothetical protein B0J13DRAFT_288384 [Dactylonectria estremocensis]